MSSINKIHSTNMSLNDRFTAIASSKQSKSRARASSKDAVASLANRNLLKELVNKEKLKAALKLKRRSLRNIGGGVGYTRANLRANNGIALTRGTVKALRVAANGRAIKTNSLSRVATMKADLVSVRTPSRALRRSNSLSNISGRLGGARRSMTGGVGQANVRGAQRAGRPVNQRQMRAGSVRRGRSRSRSVGRAAQITNNTPRGRSRSRSRAASVDSAAVGRRGRSRALSRSRTTALPVTARLGVRPRNRSSTTKAAASQRASGRQALNRRQPSVTRRGVAQGRVHKTKTTTTTSRAQAKAIESTGNGGGRIGRTRGRVTRGAIQRRSRSRTSVSAKGQRKQQTEAARGSRPGTSRRGRSQQRGGSAQRNGKQVTNANRWSGQQQQRRGRGRGRGGRVSRNEGQNSKSQPPKKEDLDKELDQYMLTTKTENTVDYLLRK